MSFRRIVTLLAILAVAAMGAGAVYLLQSRPVTVRAAMAEQNVPIQVFGLGTVEARIIANAGFEVSATLVELTADHGDLVKQGDMLARLDTAEQEASLARANANVHAAEAALGRAETLVQRQAAVLAQKEEANRRQQELVRKNVASVEKAEEAARDLSVAAADHAVALADVTVARAALETARADLQRERVLLGKHMLPAPFDAVVIERHRERGTAVKSGDTVFTLADPESIWALAHVEESRAGLIAEGQPAEVRLRSRPGAVFPARVARIGIESDRVSEERRVWVKCGQCPPGFFLGEQAEVIITVDTLASAVLVPERMVTDFDGYRGHAWVAENGRARRQVFIFSHRLLDGRLAITDPVPGGLTVINWSDGTLSEGRAVTFSEGPVR